MRKNSLKSILNRTIFASLLAVGVSGCSNYLEVNDTPNNPTDVPPSALLPTALAGTGFSNSNEINRFASTVMSVTYGAANSPASWDIYNTDASDFGNQWNFEIYGGALINYQNLITAADKINAKSYTGIAKIMKAYTFSLATDCWGDVPYSQALLGDANTQPRLDSQKDIYLGNAANNIQSLFDLVKEGLSDLNSASSIDPGVDDLAYGGSASSIDNWKRVGNTLLLKLANQISLVEPDRAKTIIAEVLSGNDYIVSNSQDLGINFGGQVGSFAPTHSYTNVSSFSNDMMISTRFVNLLKASSDPRLPKFVTSPSGAGNYVTVDNGARGLTLPLPATWSRFSSYVTGTAGQGPARLLTNFQRAFILAESAIRLGTAGDPQALYTEGITASMSLAGLTQTEITQYLNAHPEVAILSGSNDNKLQQILTQKYIAWYGNGLEQWNDWRRTGYPVLSEHQNAVGIDGKRPVRLVYTSEEIQKNPNFPKDVYSNVKVWWDVN